MRAARAGGAAVMVIDRMLHGEDGLAIIETLRNEGNSMPVLVISALSSVDDRIRGLKAGGDDYLVKPFELRELTARVEALSTARRGRARRPGCAPDRWKWISSTARCGAAIGASICCRANSNC